MKIYQIKSLDCNEKKNRKLLIKEVMRALNLEEMPDEIFLRKTCKSLIEKYHVNIKSIINYKTHFELNLNIYGDAYSTIYCNSYYEALCKYILYVKAIRKLKTEEIK